MGGVFTISSLYHHGIKGQKWGVKNGPPYPLKNNVRYRGASKEAHVRDNDGGNDSKNNRLEAVQLAAYILLDIATLNPIGLTQDTIRVGQAIASKHRNDQYTKERSLSITDKKTGLKRIPDNSNLTDMDNLKRVNPNVYDFNSDSKNNCMLCTATYEMRRRGYDVTAQRDGSGYTAGEVTRWFPKAKIVNIRKNDNDATTSIVPGGIKYADKIISELSSQPDGSRGNLMLGFIGGGHSVCYEIQNGNVIIRDAQVAKIYKNPKKILKKSFDCQYVRYDNVDFDPKTIKEVCYS